MTDESLEGRAASGEVEAQLELGRASEAASQTAAARGWFARAARSGSAAGLRLLAINLLTREPIESDRGVNMIRAAADKGDAEAAHVCAMLAAGDKDLPDRWSVARKCLEIAAERGWGLAREELAFLSKLQGKGDVSRSAETAIFESPRVSVFKGFASREECDWLIARARPRLKRAVVYDSYRGGFEVRQSRSNSAVAFDLTDCDIVVMRLRERIEATVGECRLEPLSVLHYAPGQEFKPHFDFLDDAQPGLAMDLARGGQRVATFLVYLNEGFEGGETEFPKLDWSFKGATGDALLFWNIDENGKADTRTFHAGKPPISGEKWLLSQWLRESRRKA